MDLDQSADRSRAVPRLSILHLFVWTALVAAVVALNNQLIATEMAALNTLAKGQISIVPRSPTSLALQAVPAMITGANLSGLVMIVTWRWRKIRFPWEPGEWLLVMQGVTDLIVIGLNIGRVILLVGRAILLANSSQSLIGFSYVIYSISLMVCTLLTFLVPALRCRERGNWKRFFWIAVVVPVIGSIMSAFILFHIISSAIVWYVLFRLSIIGICGIALAVAAIGDVRRHIDRTWVHWVGVATLVLSHCYQEGLTLYYLLIGHEQSSGKFF